MRLDIMVDVEDWRLQGRPLPLFGLLDISCKYCKFECCAVNRCYGLRSTTIAIEFPLGSAVTAILPAPLSVTHREQLHYATHSGVRFGFLVVGI